MAKTGYNRGTVALWVVVGLCGVYLVLWMCGVRFPRPTPPAARSEVEEVEALDDDEDMVSLSDEEFDVELPSEPVFVDDGRDYQAPLL